jgi:Mor family transcriptional regulator
MELKQEFEAAVALMKEEDMPNADMRDVARELGAEVAVKLMKQLPGAYLCVPNQHPFGKIAKKFVIDKFDGSNAKQLARVTGFSLRHIYEIVEQEDEDRAARKTKQGNLFEATASVATAG